MENNIVSTKKDIILNFLKKAFYEWDDDIWRKTIIEPQDESGEGYYQIHLNYFGETVSILVDVSLKGFIEVEYAYECWSPVTAHDSSIKFFFMAIYPNIKHNQTPIS